MPTYYTEVLCKEKMSFRDFALRCARAFCMDMRDSTGPIPRTIDTDPDIVKSLGELRVESAQISQMTDLETRKQARLVYNDIRRSFAAARQRVAKVRARLKAMLKKVQAWRVPSSDHVDLRTFMIEQLTAAIASEGKFDPPDPRLQKGWEWKKGKLQELSNRIAYYEQRQIMNLDLVVRRNKFVGALMDLAK